MVPEEKESDQSTPSRLVSTETPSNSAPDMASAQSPPNQVPQPIADNIPVSAPVGGAPAPAVGRELYFPKTADAADGAVADPLARTPSAPATSSAVLVVPLCVPVTKEKAPQKASNAYDISEFVTSKKLKKSFAVLRTRGYPEVFAIGSPELNARIRGHGRKNGKRLKQHQLDEINEELRSLAEEIGIQVDLYPRVAPLGDGGIEIDLCDDAGTKVRITAHGVQVIHGSSPTLFLRPSSALALPIPASNGDFKRLRPYINLKPASFHLYIGWVTFTIASPKVEASKYLFLVLRAIQGAGKTVASKKTKKLIDPNAVAAMMLPGNPRDLAIMLQSSHVLVIDNLRDISVLMSDALCIAATGGSMSTRQLYTDDEQKALYLHGALIFNGIHPFLGQSDLADRCLVLELDPIAPEARKSETQMLQDFEADYPVILGGLYDLIAKILQKLPEAQVVAPSRMLDFCRWLAAMEMALGMPVGALQYLYAESLRDAQLESLLDNPLAVTIIAFAEKMDEPEWTGTPTDFFDRLTSIADFGLQRSRAWPSSAAVLSKRLHGLQAPLLAQGIAIDWTRGKDRQIVVRSTKAPKPQPAPCDDQSEVDGDF